jgi:hypothetical protein
MKTVVFLLLSLGSIFLSGCADDLSPEDKNRPPAAYAPDYTGVIPTEPTERQKFERAAGGW